MRVLHLLEEMELEEFNKDVAIVEEYLGILEPRVFTSTF
jgi:hypothetical protein